MKANSQIPCRTILLLVAVLLVIILPFLVYGEAVNGWTDRLIAQAEANRFMTGLLLTALLAADILVPVPSSLVSTACGMTLGFVGGTGASFAGMSITAVVGYLIGRYASAPAERLIGKNEIALLQTFHRRHGVWLLLALRPVPVLAEASVVFSGLSRHSFPQMLAVVSLGNLAVSAVYAAVGVWGKLSDSFVPAFAGSMALSGLLIGWTRLKGRAAARPAPAGGRENGE